MVGTSPNLRGYRIRAGGGHDRTRSPWHGAAKHFPLRKQALPACDRSVTVFEFGGRIKTTKIATGVRFPATPWCEDAMPRGFASQADATKTMTMHGICSAQARLGCIAAGRIREDGRAISSTPAATARRKVRMSGPATRVSTAPERRCPGLRRGIGITHPIASCDRVVRQWRRRR
jgi:hypothetical protein